MPPKSTAKAKPDETLPETPAPESGDQTGDGGAREAEVSTAIDRLDTLADEIDLGDDAAAIVATATEWGIELYKHRPKPWSELSQSEQRDVAAGIEHNMKELVRQIVEAVARNGRSAIRCLLVGFTDKGEDIKAELKVKALSIDETELAVLGLHRARGKHVLLTVASADDYAGVPARDHSEPDQTALGFEAGSDEHPTDDSDLVAAAEPPALELAQTGNQMLVPNQGLCEIRVNLKTGMIEAKAEGRDDFDIDVRAATSVELAAERDRQADFAEPEAEAQPA